MPAALEMDSDDRAAPGGPLALHAIEPVIDVEHQVVPAPLDERPKYDDPHLDRMRGDGRLGDRSFQR